MGSIYRSTVIKNALAWVGYKEDEGAPNWTIFTKILDGCGYYAPQEKQGTQWCGHFCNCMLLLSAVPEDRDDEAKKYDAQNYQGQPSYNNLSASCRYYADYFRKIGRFDDKPQLGDIIFFGPRGAETHQGLVVDLDDYITTVEGNAGDAVQKKWYSFDDIGGRISGFGHPLYDDEDDKPEPEPDHDDDEDDQDLPKTVSIDMDILKIGDKGNQVETLQILLNAFGYSDQDGNKLAVDSIFGSRTDYAVKAFQENHDIENDGIVGFQTWSALLK